MSSILYLTYQRSWIQCFPKYLNLRLSWALSVLVNVSCLHAKFFFSLEISYFSRKKKRRFTRFATHSCRSKIGPHTHTHSHTIQSDISFDFMGTRKKMRLFSACMYWYCATDEMILFRYWSLHSRDDDRCDYVYLSRNLRIYPQNHDVSFRHRRWLCAICSLHSFSFRCVIVVFKCLRI